MSEKSATVVMPCGHPYGDSANITIDQSGLAKGPVALTFVRDTGEIVTGPYQPISLSRKCDGDIVGLVQPDPEADDSSAPFNP